MMHIFLCDDNAICLSDLMKILNECAALNRWEFRISCFSDGNLLLEELKRRKSIRETLPDVVISDVEMPQMDGITLGKYIKKEIPDCYFVLQTAFAEYAIDGYETGACRYLLKPVQKDAILKLFLEIFESRSKEKKIILKTTEEEICLNIQQIIYIDAEDKYLMVHTVGGNYLVRGTLGEFEEELQEFGFFRIHRKFLANMWHHKSIRNDKLIMGNGDVLPLSRRKENAYKSAFLRFMEERGR